MASKRVWLVAGGVAAAGFYFFPGSAPKSNIFETDGVKNVGNAFASAGGTTTHAPAVATKRGDPNDNVSRQQEMKGIGTPHFEENHAAQKAGTSNPVEKAFRQAHSGSDRGK